MNWIILSCLVISSLSITMVKQVDAAVTEIKSAEELRNIMKDSVTVVFYDAERCGSCRLFRPIFNTLSAQHTNKKFVIVNVDRLPEIASECGVSELPTFKVFKNGEVVSELVGPNSAGLSQLVAREY